MQNIEKDILTYVNTIVDKKADEFIYIFTFLPKQSFLLLIKKKQPYILYSFLLISWKIYPISPSSIRKANFKTVFTYR